MLPVDKGILMTESAIVPLASAGKATKFMEFNGLAIKSINVYILKPWTAAQIRTHPALACNLQSWPAETSSLKMLSSIWSVSAQDDPQRDSCSLD